MNSREIRKALEIKWNDYLSQYSNQFASDSVSGSTPPSVFVGSYNYPKVSVGPMVPPLHGDTSLLDYPERWVGKSLDDIVNFRINLIRGIKTIPAQNTAERYIQNLQEMIMSSRPSDSELEFSKKPSLFRSIDGESAPFGPIGEIKNAKFSNISTDKKIERSYYDRDLKAEEAIISLYNSGVEISRLQKCFSLGMFGKKRKLVPTRWSVTATDDIISKNLASEILENPILETYQVHFFSHLGNNFAVILFPTRYFFEMQEAWYSNGILGFGADYEDARGIKHPPSIEGAYFAGRLAVTEYLSKNKIQAGIMVLREIRPEYSIPVGVWQVREGIRQAMKSFPSAFESFNNAIIAACKPMSISKNDWLSRSEIKKLTSQKAISDFF